MVTHAQHPAVFQINDEIRMAHRADALGDEHRGGMAVILPQRLSQPGIGSIVQSGRRIVQNQNFRIRRQSSGNQQPLLLSAGEVVAPDMDFRVHFPLFGLNKFRLGSLGSRHQVGIFQLPEEIDVMSDGAFRDEVILEHHTELFPQNLIGNGADILSVDLDAAFVGIVQPQKQIDDGRLARAGRA